MHLVEVLQKMDNKKLTSQKQNLNKIIFKRFVAGYTVLNKMRNENLTEMKFKQRIWK